jgi:hypothetical protein
MGPLATHEISFVVVVVDMNQAPGRRPLAYEWPHAGGRRNSQGSNLILAEDREG